ncbi:hypothetical protein H6P81_019133 [Aristolochia fimbriata]|uniref:DCD domain-containing protein n=1 Tax=Aristolochia fimbriata TaxID=158543 RepID=A0AAV7DQU9_ARIFI|nr:hypothetical protein H6P81_019133 [Aristolochia fimbriata]
MDDTKRLNSGWYTRHTSGWHMRLNKEGTRRLIIQSLKIFRKSAEDVCKFMDPHFVKMFDLYLLLNHPLASTNFNNSTVKARKQQKGLCIKLLTNLTNLFAQRFMDLAGAIFMCNCETKKECLERKLFGLPLSQSSLVRELKIGMMLFLFEYGKRELYGVYEATSDGGCNIEPYAFTSSGKAFGAQIRFKTLWSCHPMSEPEFCDAIKDNYYTSNKFKFSLSLEQVKDLLRLFSSRLIKPKLLKNTEIGDGSYRQSGCRVNLNATGKQEDSFQTESLKSRERGDEPYRQSGCRVSLNATGKQEDSSQTESLKSRERGDGPYRQSGCRVSLNAIGKQEDRFQTELLKSREIGDGSYRHLDCRMNANAISRSEESFVRQLSNTRFVNEEITRYQQQVMPSKLPSSYEPRLSHSALPSYHGSGSFTSNFQDKIASSLHDNFNYPKTLSSPEKDNPLFSSGTSHTLDLQQLSGGYTSGPKVVHPYSRSHFYEPSSGHISVNTNSRCTDNSSRTCYDDYIALPLSEQCDPAILDTGFFGHRYFEQITPKVDSYKSSAGNEVRQLLNPATMSMAGRIIDDGRRNFGCEPHLSLTPYMDAQELKKTTMDPPHHLGSLLQENESYQSPELHNKYYESADNTCFRSDPFQSRQSVFARLSGLPKAQDNEGFDDAESYESPTVVVSLSKALELLGQRMNRWKRKGKYKSSNSSNGKGTYVLEDAAREVDRHLSVEVDTTGESDTKQSFEPTFLNFKRRSQVKKEIGKIEVEKHGEGGGMVSDGSARKQKRRKLLRPSFDKEGASYVGYCQNQNLEGLFQDKEGASYVGDCKNQNLEVLFQDKEGATYVGDCKNQSLEGLFQDKEGASYVGDCKNQNLEGLFQDSTESRLAEEEKNKLLDGCATAIVEAECGKEKV